MKPADQLERLRKLLAEIVPANRFVTRRLGAIGELRDLADFTKRVPFTHKQDLVADQAAHPPYGTNHTCALERYTRFCQTSGTTARPLIILDTPESWDWMLGNWSEIYRAAGAAPGDRAYFAFSFGPFLGFWTAFEAAAKLGMLCIPGGGLSTAARIRAILQHEATILCCTPTYALHMAEIAQTESIDLSTSRVRKLIVAGEPGGSVPGVREQIESAWPGAEVLDHYGMTEVGPVALQRPGDRDVLHVLEGSYFAEVIDPVTGAPSPEEIGELVLTTLGRSAAPLLRYRTGDLVRRDATRPGFALAGGIIGRADDMVVVRGVNIYPSAIDAAVRSVPKIAEYRVNVSRRGSLAEIEIDVEAPSEDAVAELREVLSVAFALRIPVRQVPAGTLPRFEMKARRWVVRE